MPGQTYADAQVARDQLMKHMGRNLRRKLSGSALERLPDGGWGIVILLDHRLRKPLPVPAEFAGTPIRVAEIGPSRALA